MLVDEQDGDVFPFGKVLEGRLDNVCLRLFDNQPIINADTMPMFRKRTYWDQQSRSSSSVDCRYARSPLTVVQ